MRFEIITEPASLAALRDEWSRLSCESPMQSLEWLATWWSCYANASRELFVVVAREDDELIGVAPWYIELRRNRRVVRWLGDGRVCSDHMSLLSLASHRRRFTEALVRWLLNDTNDRWNEVQLEAIDADNTACRKLIDVLVSAGCLPVKTEQTGNCYVDLPPTFEAYLMAISKNHRKRCRRWDKLFFQSGRARIHVATTPDDCLANWQALVQLHNTRRSSLGQQGAFEDPSFAGFHQQVIPKLAALGNVQLRVLEVDGRPMAAEYQLQDEHSWYAYQSGLSEAGEDVSAGSLSILAMVKDAIAAGCQRLDFLRGDEPYKFSWGAVHRSAYSITLRRPSYAAQLLTLRDSAWMAAKRIKRAMVPTSL